MVGVWPGGGAYPGEAGPIFLRLIDFAENRAAAAAGLTASVQPRRLAARAFLGTPFANNLTGDIVTTTVGTQA